MYQERLYMQIRQMVNSHEDANDILQNTFMKAWAGIDDFRDESQLYTWLYRIAANETLNFLHHSRRIITTDESVLAEQLSHEEYDGEELQRLLMQAVEQLPPRQRQVFTMKYFQGMKYEEMSLLLGTTVGSLKANYHHAVDKITAFFHRLD